MTVDEAIQVLRDWDGYFIGHSSDDVNEALNMAIEALKQELKIGHWKRVYNDQWLLKCPFCEHAFIEHQMPHEYDKNYCPSCGTKMIEPIESEE